MSKVMNEIRRGVDIMRRLTEENERDAKEVDTKDETTDGGVPYSNEDQLMSSVMNSAKQNFMASFSGIEHPMMYYPDESDGNIILTGLIPSMNNAKFEFKYKDSSGCGCRIWADSLILTDENIKTLSVIHGTYNNWVHEIGEAEDIKPMGYSNKDKESTNESVIRRGDDIPE